MDIDRRRSSMVLFEFERALGQFIMSASAGVEFDHSVIERIGARKIASKNISGASPHLDEVIKHCYLEDLLQLSQYVAKGTAYELNISRIKSLCTSLDVYEVRNACAHPLRDFPRQYWYKVAALVSDASLQRLGMESPIAALAAAEGDMLTDPPAEWLARFNWELPNNLPDRVEHDVTGLIGRKDIQKKLFDLVSNPRNAAVAVVARGGVGKTALALEMLRSAVSDPAQAESFDCVLYVSLKTEILTAHGVKRTEAAKSLTELELELVDAINEAMGETHAAFDVALEAHSLDKVVLCIDNLESLLRDQPDLFQLINERLPASWRLLITSRIRVDGAFTVPIDDLQRQDAVALAHKYSRAKGLTLPGEIGSDLAGLARNNPLAVKLTVDLMSTGSDLHSAAEIASAEIAQFAYDRLIDALSDAAVKCLEVVFVYDGCSRADIIGAINIDSDSVAEAVAELANTSLIFRDLDEFEERFHLNESVRDFLRVNTRNIKFRGEVEASLRRARDIQASAQSEQERQGVHVHAIAYVPADIPVQLSQLAFAVNNQFKHGNKRNSKQIGRLLEQFRTFESEFSSYEVYWRFYGRLMSLVDTGSAISLLSKAEEIDPGKPQAFAVHGWLLIKVGRSADANRVFESLYERGWCSSTKAGKFLASYVRAGLLRSLLFTGQFARLLDETASWESCGPDALEEGVARLGALRQMDGESTQKAKSFGECLEIVKELALKFGYTRELCSQTIKVYKDITHWIRFRDLDSDICSAAIESMAKHLPNMTALVSKVDIDSLSLEALCSSNSVSPEIGEQISSLRQRLMGVSAPQVSALAKSGYIVLVVSAPPRFVGQDLGRYLFAKNAKGQDYYISIDVLKNGGWVEWARIEKGEQIIVKPRSGPTARGKSPAVLEAFLTREN